MSSRPTIEIDAHGIDRGPSISNQALRQIANDRMALIERELQTWPAGFRLAVSAAQFVQDPRTLNYKIEWTFQALAPGQAPSGADAWTIYGPLPVDHPGKTEASSSDAEGLASATDQRHRGVRVEGDSPY